jgi:peptidoglycan hydrolase-like protein with peptidoglycan-binding domain
MRAGAARLNGDDFSGRRKLRMPFPIRFLMRVPFLLRWLVPRSRDSIAGALAGLAALAILVNALFMQSGPHPAPIFANKPAPLVAPAFGPVSALLPHRPPSDAKIEVASNARPRADMLADIQRVLSKRGFYDGAADGVYGPKTDAAIRDFEQAAGLRPAAEPNDALLAAIVRSSVKAVAPAVRSDPIAELLAPNKRLIAIQRALADFGYGPIQPSGVHDAETRSAIERFERARRRPVTGHVSEQLVRDLAAMTGRPLEW